MNYLLLSRIPFSPMIISYYKKLNEGQGLDSYAKGWFCELNLTWNSVSRSFKPIQMIDKSVNKYVRHATNRAAIRVISSVTAVTQQKQLLIITFTANLAKLKVKWNTFAKSECATFYIDRKFKLNNSWMLPKVNILPKKYIKEFLVPTFYNVLRPERGKNRHVTGWEDSKKTLWVPIRFPAIIS